MKHLKKYKLFLEDFEVEDSDSEDVKLSKEKLDRVKTQISYYNSNKSKIDKIYQDLENGSIKDDLDKVIGTGKDTNPFLVSYSSIASITRSIEKLKKRETDKSIEKNELKDRLSDASDDISKDISDRISKVNDQIIKIKKDINDASKKLPVLEKSHKEKMDNIEQDIKDWISKIK
jgi:chromosome segregation ATPase